LELIAAPPAKKRKTAPASNEKAPVVINDNEDAEDDEDVPEDDGNDDQEDSADEDAPEVSLSRAGCERILEFEIFKIKCLKTLRPLTLSLFLPLLTTCSNLGGFYLLGYRSSKQGKSSQGRPSPC